MKRFQHVPKTLDAEHGKLLAALKAEEMQAVGYETSAEVTAHVEALDRYFGKPYGDEVDGRSKITTREIYETIAWLVPDLLDVFAAGGRICDMEAGEPDAEGQIELRADYLNYVFFKDNDGVLILHDFIFDALMHKRAYADVEWDAEPVYAGWEEYSNLSPMQVEALIQDEATEIDPQSLKEGPIDPSPDYPEGIAYALKARKRLMDGKLVIEVPAPEDMFVNGRAVDMATARYKGRLLRWRRSDWARHFPDMREEIMGYVDQGEGASIDTDERRSARFDDDQASYGEWATAANKMAEELTGRKEYIWYADPDTDDDPVLLRVYRLGDVILEVEEVDDDPFASTAAHRVPHRLQGLNIPEILGDLQRLKTVLTRALVDGTQQANVPRIGADQNKVNLDDLLNLDYGAVIRTEGAPGDSIMPVLTPDLSASTLKALEWTNQIIEQRSGVSRHGQGMDPDSLNHTARGIQLIQNAANSMKRLLARLIAVGVEEMLTKADRAIMRNQKSARVVRLGKEWKRVDPRSWSPSMRVSVTVGLGTGAKDAQLAFLQMIKQAQTEWVASFGPATPVITPKHLYNTFSEMLRVMGYPSPDRFAAEPPDGWAPPPPSDPNAAKAQADMQLKQMELQANAQMKQAEVASKENQTRLQAEKDERLAMVQQRDEMVRANLQAQSDAQKAELERGKLMLEEERLAFERERAAAEMQLKERELEIREREISMRALEAEASRRHEGEQKDKDRKMKNGVAHD